MVFMDLFFVALMPMLKTLLITGVGLFLALDCVNLLNTSARHHLNHLVFYLFTPALVASSVADTVTGSSIVSLWFMPVNMLLSFIIGSTLGWILVKITRPPQHLHGLVIASCTAGNVGNMLFIIIPAVCKEKNSPFGDPTVCSTKGEAYASLSAAIGVVYIWSYIYNIIRAYGRHHRCRDADMNNSETNRNKFAETPGNFPDGCRDALLSNDCSSSDDHEAQADLLVNVHKDTAEVTVIMKMKQKLLIVLKNINLKMLFAPSTIATIVGLFIGLISPIRKLMVGDSAPLRAVESSASMIGDGSIPSMTLIVGANLLKGLRKSELGFWVVTGILVIRFVALPLSGIAVVKAAVNFEMVGSDSLYQFVLLLQYALPAAMSISTITQIFEVGESDCSVIMLWNYGVATFALTLWIAYYMWLLS